MQGSVVCNRRPRKRSGAVGDPLRPRALRPGDTVALVAPSRPSDPELLDRAAGYLENRGFRVARGRHVHDRYHYLGGRDADRARDLMEAFLDDRVAALLCARGGFGTGRVVDLLDYDAIAAHPKAVVGFSDSTGLHLALYARTRLVGFTGALADFDLGGDRPDPLLEDWLWRLLTALEAPGPLPTGPAGLTVWRRGSATGPLVPANLALLCSLLGTPYAPRLEGAVLLLEDVSEFPYRVDRMLTQLRLAGVLGGLSALVLGVFQDCFAPPEMDRSPTLEELVIDAVGGYDLPVVSGVEYGHRHPRAVLPVGVPACVEAGRHGGEVRLLEAAVTA